jgi:hypothetical protein
MIILLAMRNSLAAREYAPRGPIGPPARAARGVYVGDGKVRKPVDRRCVRNAFRRRSVVAKRLRRQSGGRLVVDLPSGHRQPENKA